MAIQTGLLNLQDFRPTPESYGINKVHIPFDNINCHKIPKCEIFIVPHLGMTLKADVESSPLTSRHYKMANAKPALKDKRLGTFT
jgi:hypothetical protein